MTKEEHWRVRVCWSIWWIRCFTLKGTSPYLPYLESGQNRFGSTNEIDIFEMQSGGLVEVLNPSQVFLEERLDGATGSSIVVTMEGTVGRCGWGANRVWGWRWMPVTDERSRWRLGAEEAGGLCAKWMPVNHDGQWMGHH